MHSLFSPLPGLTRLARQVSVWGVALLACACGSPTPTSPGPVDSASVGLGLDSGSGDAGDSYCLGAETSSFYEYCGELIPGEVASLLCTGSNGQVVTACPSDAVAGVCTIGGLTEEWAGTITYYKSKGTAPSVGTAAQDCEDSQLGTFKASP